jgi:hypothetical protein
MNETQKDRLATIISGLAASGHYTHLKQVQTGKKTPSGEVIFEDMPFLKDIDWDSGESKSRYHITEDALAILQELDGTEF